jgi:DNA repair protein RecO (recombination protein O)
MKISTRAIILQIIKYNDTDAIIKAYTEHTGYTGYYVKSYFSTKSRKYKKALLQPGALVEMIVTHKNKDTLEYIKEVNTLYHYKNLHTNFDKLNIATFIREILLESLKNEQGDKTLFQFIYNSFVTLDTSFKPANFHLYFLLKLTEYLGFFPDIKNEGYYFDLLNGTSSESIPPHPFLDKKETIWFKQISGMIFAVKNDIKIQTNDKKKYIDIMLTYYQLHIAGFKTPKSVEILHKIYE